MYSHIYIVFINILWNLFYARYIFFGNSVREGSNSENKENQPIFYRCLDVFLNSDLPESNGGSVFNMLSKVQISDSVTDVNKRFNITY